MKPELLEFERLEKIKMLPVKLFLLTKLKTRLLTLPLPDLPNQKKTAETRRGWRGSAV